MKTKIMPYKDLMDLIKKDPIVAAVAEDRQIWVARVVNEIQRKIGKFTIRPVPRAPNS